MSYLKIKCFGCGNIFLKIKKEYDRQIRNGNTNFYCSSKCCGKYTSSKRIKHSEIERECLFCKVKFVSTTHKRHKKCCSKKCAVKYSQSYVDNNKISKSLKNYYYNNPRCKIKLKCIICNSIFLKLKNKNKTCSDICYRKLLSVNSTNNPNCGGETNFKKFKYKGIWMDSSWEVNIAKWLDFYNVKWIRDRKIYFIWTDEFEKKRRYYPDFYLPEYNLYLDPKNKFKLEKDKYKLNKVINENKIKLLYGLEETIIKDLIKIMHQ